MAVPHHTRSLAAAAAGVAALALTAGAVLTATVPSADAAPVTPADAAPHTKSRPAAGARNLPAQSTMAWFESGDWRSEGTTRSAEPTATTPCTTRPVNDYRGAKATTWERSFILRATDNDSARAVVVQFDSAAHASAAERAVTRELRTCQETLQAAAAYVQVGQPAPSRRVSTKVGKARFTETSYQSVADADADPYSSTFEATGTVRFGRRLLVVTMATRGQDDNWSHVADDPTGLPLHPMYRTLPAAAKRLAR